MTDQLHELRDIAQSLVDRIDQMLEPTPPPPPPEPTGLIQPGDIRYLGYFRLPIVDRGPQHHHFGLAAGTIAYRSETDTLLVPSHPYGGVRAEVSIPSYSEDYLGGSTSPIAQITKPFHDPYLGERSTEAMRRHTPDFGSLSGHMSPAGAVYDQDGFLWLSMFEWYNVDGSDWPHKLVVTPSGEVIGGPWRLSVHHERTAGYLCIPPAEWSRRWFDDRDVMLCGMSVSERVNSSHGPALTAFEIPLVGSLSPAGSMLNATELLRYNIPTEQTFPNWTPANLVTSLTFPVAGDKQSLVYFGRQGTPPGFYDGSYQAPPYHPIAWLYDPDAIVRNVQDDEPDLSHIKPYATIDLSQWLLPEPSGDCWACWDQERRRFYVLQPRVDKTRGLGVEPYPVIHVLEVS